MNDSQVDEGSIIKGYNWPEQIETKFIGRGLGVCGYCWCSILKDEEKGM